MSGVPEDTLLPMTGMTLGEARSKISGWHFAKESLTEGEREMLYVTEGLLRLIDSPGEKDERAVVTLVLPEISADRASVDLRHLTQVLVLNGLCGDQNGTTGLLGGEYGYGVEFENETFSMHPYCWCDQDDCPWCAGCSCPDDAVLYFDRNGNEVSVDRHFDLPESERGPMQDVPDKQCDYCKGGRKSAPNFLHKPSGSTVHWYKYIGRGMEIDLREDWGRIINGCIKSVQQDVASKAGKR